MTIERNPGIDHSRFVGYDILGNLRAVQTVVRGDGVVAMPIDGTVTVQSTFGADPLPDSYFQIINTGLAGDTITLYIAGTNGDPTTPDRDIPSYTKVFTVLAGEVGDELALRNRIVSELNLDSGFKLTRLLKAQVVQDRSIVHISSTAFSLSGEFYERPLAGDFMVNTTGTAQVIVGYDNMISRSKPVVLDRDPNNPHRSGVFGISGSVFVTAKALEDIFIQDATNMTYGSNMLVNGSLATPIDFYVNASPTTDIFIEEMIFDGQGSSIKFAQFLSKSTALTNGILVTIKSDNVITTLPLIKNTEDFKNKFAALSGSAYAFSIIAQPSLHDMLAIFDFKNPFVLRVQGTFGVGNDDYIKISIRDDLSSGNTRLNFRAKGFEKEP
jgi:hypothetical protein